MKKLFLLFLVFGMTIYSGSASAKSYTIVDTGQEACFNNNRQIKCPEPGDDFYGQDAQYIGNESKYIDNGDGTITDLVTGLMWVKARGEKKPWQQAMDGAEDCRVGGYEDWRAPTIKELYSLIDFNGRSMAESGSVPFIDTKYFDFKFGNTSAGERSIDCQDWSSTVYKGRTMNNNPTAFGVNFADGRIKGYGNNYRRKQDKKYIRYVRGNPDYGKNKFTPRNDGTVEDQATGLIWQQGDSTKAMNWEEALSYCANLKLAGHSNWRLPNAKELQSLVDYSRSPTSTDSAAISPLFNVTEKESYYYTSTTHYDGPSFNRAVYIAFGRAMGYMSFPHNSGTKKFIDVHGAGAQRSDPKSGNPDAFPQGHGPQGDDIRIYNYVRCVTGGDAKPYTPPYKKLTAPAATGMRSGVNTTFQGRKNGQKGAPGSGFQHQFGGSGMENGGMGNRQGMQQGHSSGDRGQHGPPQEAFDACEGKATGDSCSFTAPHGTISGVCAERNGRSFCIPENHGGGMGMRFQ